MKIQNEYKKQPEGGLLQSAIWKQILINEGFEVVDVIDDKGEKFFGVIYHISLIGKYLYIPRFYNLNQKNIERIIDVAKSNNCKWVRLDVEDIKKLKDKKINLQKAPHDMQPKNNLIIDISKSEDLLLKEMKSKTRYNIRLAKKRGVKILKTRDKKYLDIFYELVNKTGDRKGVTFHNYKHYKEILDNTNDKQLQLFVALYDNKYIAINMITFYNGVATYLHGATSNEHRNVMAPFLLQWEAILESKKKKVYLV